LIRDQVTVLGTDIVGSVPRNVGVRRQYPDFDRLENSCISAPGTKFVRLYAIVVGLTAVLTVTFWCLIFASDEAVRNYPEVLERLGNIACIASAMESLGGGTAWIALLSRNRVPRALLRICVVVAILLFLLSIMPAIQST